MSERGWDDDPYYGEDDDYEEGERRHHEEWVSLGYGVWLILHTFPDGSATVLWAIDRPGGGQRNHYVRDTTYREDHCQAWAGEGPHALASLRNLAIGLIRMKGVTAIKETTEWIAGDRMRALEFMAT